MTQKDNPAIRKYLLESIRKDANDLLKFADAANGMSSKDVQLIHRAMVTNDPFASFVVTSVNLILDLYQKDIPGEIVPNKSDGGLQAKHVVKDHSDDYVGYRGVELVDARSTIEASLPTALKLKAESNRLTNEAVELKNTEEIGALNTAWTLGIDGWKIE